MTPCDQSHLLSPYLDGELSSTEASAVARHLAACPACAAEADEILAVSRLMVAARVGLGPAAGDTEDVMGRLRLHVQDLVGSVDTSLIWMARIFSGVAACVLIGGLWLLSAASPSTHGPIASGSPTGTDVQPVQLSLMPDPVVDLSSDSLASSQAPAAAEPTTRESVLARLTGLGDSAIVADAATTEDDNR